MQQRGGTFTEEARPLTPLGHDDGGGGTVAWRSLARVGQKKKKYSKKEEDNDGSIWINDQ